MTRSLRKQLEQRLNELKKEYESGQSFLAELESRQANVKEALLRIAGAVQVLEEELAKTEEIDYPMEDPSEGEPMSTRFSNGLRTTKQPNPANL